MRDISGFARRTAQHSRHTRRHSRWAAIASFVAATMLAAAPASARPVTQDVTFEQCDELGGVTTCIGMDGTVTTNTVAVRDSFFVSQVHLDVSSHISSATPGCTDTITFSRKGIDFEIQWRKFHRVTHLVVLDRFVVECGVIGLPPQNCTVSGVVQLIALEDEVRTVFDHTETTCVPVA